MYFGCCCCDLSLVFVDQLKIGQTNVHIKKKKNNTHQRAKSTEYMSIYVRFVVVDAVIYLCAMCDEHAMGDVCVWAAKNLKIRPRIYSERALAAVINR